MLLSDLASFPKGLIKMLRKFFVCIFLGIKSVFRTSCMFSRKAFRYLSFAWPKLRQVVLLWEGSLKSWPVSTLPLLQPAWCSLALPMARSSPRAQIGTTASGKEHMAAVEHRGHPKIS